MGGRHAFRLRIHHHTSSIGNARLADCCISTRALRMGRFRFRGEHADWGMRRVHGPLVGNYCADWQREQGWLVRGMRRHGRTKCMHRWSEGQIESFPKVRSRRMYILLSCLEVSRARQRLPLARPVRWGITPKQNKPHHHLLPMRPRMLNEASSHVYLYPFMHNLVVHRAKRRRDRSRAGWFANQPPQQTPNRSR